MPNFISEDQIEQALLQRLQHVCGFDVLECYTTDPTDLNDWYKTDQTRRIVRSAVAEVLDRELPQESYDRALFQTKCDNVFHLVLDHAAQGRKWAA